MIIADEVDLASEDAITETGRDDASVEGAADFDETADCAMIVVL